MRAAVQAPLLPGVRAFALGLMAKPMVMTLPILLLLDWWPLKRRAFAEKLPMFAWRRFPRNHIDRAQPARLRSIGARHLSLGQRIANLLVSYVRYLELYILAAPTLPCCIPFRTAMPLWQAAAAAVLLAAITLAALWQARRRPYLIVGWLWFAYRAAAGRRTGAGRDGRAWRTGSPICRTWGLRSQWSGARPICWASARRVAAAPRRRFSRWRASGNCRSGATA